MGFWARLMGKEEIRDNTPEITPPVSDVLLEALLKGETIDRKKALTLPAVSGAVDFISNTIASMPVKLYKVKDGRVEEQEKDTRVKLLNGDTGDTLDAFQMKKAMVADYLLGKGGYCFIERKRNDVVALRYVEEIYITILKNFKPIFKDYQILVEGQAYEPYQFIKLLRNTIDGGSGTGLTAEISKLLETAYHTLLYQLNLVESGGNKKGFLCSEHKLGQPEINTLKEAWENMYSNNHSNIVVLNNGLKFQEASNTSVEMQLDQNKKTLEQEIEGVFHISDDWNETFKKAIYPIVKAFETALNRDLLLEKEKKNHFFEFDVKEILRATLKERYEAYKLAKETGFMTLNEIRRAENMNYIDGLDVINVGLGAVLYDTDLHKYYTPNTGTVGDLENGNVEEQGSVQGNNNNGADDGLEKMLENHELAEAYDESGNSAERQERYNENHDSKTGRFTAGSGGGSDSSGGNKSKDEKIAELEKQLSEAKGIFAKARIETELNMIKEDWKGTKEEYLANKKRKQEEAAKKSQQEITKQKADAEAKAKAEKQQLENELKTQPKEKVQQYQIVKKYNPMRDDYHVGIRKPSDIKTWKEAIDDAQDNGDFEWGDFSKADAEKALKSGQITLYSSKPIKQGTFVSTSKVQSEQYAGGAGKKLYTKTVPLEKVAWISGDEGQYADIDAEK